MLTCHTHLCSRTIVREHLSTSEETERGHLLYHIPSHERERERERERVRSGVCNKVCVIRCV